MKTNGNQGEGNRQADRVYREAAEGFVRGGRVERAAAASVAALDGPESDLLGDAERAGKRHIAEDDSRRADPLPSFWTARQESAWARVKAALRRDWEQTKTDFGLGMAHLHQSAGDTIRQATGRRPLPGEETGLDWDLSRHAIRLGYGAASFWSYDRVWGEALEDRLRVEWTAMATGLPFEDAIPLVRYGWEKGRRDMARDES
jgi:hypothetical protein